MVDPVYAVEVSLLILVVGSLVSLAVSSRPRFCGWISVAFAGAAAVSTWLAAAAALTGGPYERTVLSLPQLGAGLVLSVDPLSAIFLAIMALVALLSTIYSVRYMEHYTRDKVGAFYPLLLLCMASMIGVLISADLLCFVVFWESMTLTSYFLVTYERESAASQRAGLKYFIITHGATLCMLAATLLVWRTSGSFHFEAVRQALLGLLATQPVEANLIVFLFFLGFATKAGILPMGDWLPDAHPVAPSGMSALLSGVLVKLGIYGLVRLFCSFLAPSPALRIWGIAIALAGTASLFVGTLTALRQTDTKRLMAFHTIGQIGYICLGLGVGAYCLVSSPLLASIGLVGAILHAVNHACFKSCLFLGAGSVLYRTGTRDMDQLGGLAQSMPYTAGSTTIASLSIAGVPPFNGFTSKWLIIAACILAGRQFPLFVLLGLVALFISIATLASFLKVLGAVFLGRANENSSAQEVPASMYVPQAVLAGFCILLGVFPQPALRLIGRAVESVSSVPASAVAVNTLGGGVALVDGTAVAFWWPVVMLGGLMILSLLAYGIQRAARAKRRTVPVWYCGEQHAAAAVRYPASSFYLPFKHAFTNIYPAGRLPVPRFPAVLRRLLDFDRWLYTPAVHAVEQTADGVSRTHVGTPQIYLLWIVIGAVVVAGIMLALAR
jgi:hydrogenase-4 component B